MSPGKILLGRCVELVTSFHPNPKTDEILVQVLAEFAGFFAKVRKPIELASLSFGTQFTQPIWVHENNATVGFA